MPSTSARRGATLGVRLSPSGVGFNVDLRCLIEGQGLGISPTLDILDFDVFDGWHTLTKSMEALDAENKPALD
jgi:hypothetical protein